MKDCQRNDNKEEVILSRVNFCNSCSLKKENEELKAQIEQLSNDNHVLKTSFITQQEQIERMRCCGNCSEPCWNPPIVRKLECLSNNYSLWEIAK